MTNQYHGLDIFVGEFDGERLIFVDLHQKINETLCLLFRAVRVKSLVEEFLKVSVELLESSLETGTKTSEIVKKSEIREEVGEKQSTQKGLSLVQDVYESLHLGSVLVVALTKSLSTDDTVGEGQEKLT